MPGIGEVTSLVLVGAFWGCTNPLLRKGSSEIQPTSLSAGAEQSSSDDKKSLVRSLARSLSKFVHIKVWLPYLLNQAGSVLFYFTLATSDLSLSVPICNSLALVFSILMSYLIGERIRQPIRTFVGASLVTIGVAICLVAQDASQSAAETEQS